MYSDTGYVDGGIIGVDNYDNMVETGMDWLYGEVVTFIIEEIAEGEPVHV